MENIFVRNMNSILLWVALGISIIILLRRVAHSIINIIGKKLLGDSFLVEKVGFGYLSGISWTREGKKISVSTSIVPDDNDVLSSLRVTTTKIIYESYRIDFIRFRSRPIRWLWQHLINWKGNVDIQPTLKLSIEKPKVVVGIRISKEKQFEEVDTHENESFSVKHDNSIGKRGRVNSYASIGSTTSTTSINEKQEQYNIDSNPGFFTSLKRKLKLIGMWIVVHFIPFFAIIVDNLQCRFNFSHLSNLDLILKFKEIELQTLSFNNQGLGLEVHLLSKLISCWVERKDTHFGVRLSNESLNRFLYSEYQETSSPLFEIFPSSLVMKYSGIITKRYFIPSDTFFSFEGINFMVTHSHINLILDELNNAYFSTTSWKKANSNFKKEIDPRSVSIFAEIDKSKKRNDSFNSLFPSFSKLTTTSNSIFNSLQKSPIGKGSESSAQTGYIDADYSNSLSILIGSMIKKLVNHCKQKHILEVTLSYFLFQYEDPLKNIIAVEINDFSTKAELTQTISPTISSSFRCQSFTLNCSESQYAPLFDVVGIDFNITIETESHAKSFSKKLKKKKKKKIVNPNETMQNLLGMRSDLLNLSVSSITINGFVSSIGVCIDSHGVSWIEFGIFLFKTIKSLKSKIKTGNNNRVSSNSNLSFDSSNFNDERDFVDLGIDYKKKKKLDFIIKSKFIVSDFQFSICPSNLKMQGINFSISQTQVIIDISKLGVISVNIEEKILSLDIINLKTFYSKQLLGTNFNRKEFNSTNDNFVSIASGRLFSIHSASSSFTYDYKQLLARDIGLEVDSVVVVISKLPFSSFGNIRNVFTEGHESFSTISNQVPKDYIIESPKPLKRNYKREIKVANAVSGIVQNIAIHIAESRSLDKKELKAKVLNFSVEMLTWNIDLNSYDAGAILQNISGSYQGSEFNNQEFEFLKMNSIRIQNESRVQRKRQSHDNFVSFKKSPTHNKKNLNRIFNRHGTSNANEDKKNQNLYTTVSSYTVSTSIQDINLNWNLSLSFGLIFIATGLMNSVSDFRRSLKKSKDENIKEDIKAVNSFEKLSKSITKFNFVFNVSDFDFNFDLIHNFRFITKIRKITFNSSDGEISILNGSISLNEPSSVYTSYSTNNYYLKSLRLDLIEKKPEIVWDSITIRSIADFLDHARRVFGAASNINPKPKSLSFNSNIPSPGKIIEIKGFYLVIAHDYMLGDCIDSISLSYKIIRMFFKNLSPEKQPKEKSESKEQPFTPVIFHFNNSVIVFENDYLDSKLAFLLPLQREDNIERIKRENILLEQLVDANEEEIMFALTEMSIYNSELYCKRVKSIVDDRMNENIGYTEIDLCTITSKSFDIAFTSDSDLCGVASKEILLNKFDSFNETPLGPWNTLRGSYVLGQVLDLRMSIGDFSRDLLWSEQLVISGTVILAELGINELLSKRTVLWGTQDSEKITVSRSFSPVKIYHDLSFHASGPLELSYAPTLEPLLARFSLATGRLTSASTNPSPPLPWWDKLRYLFHGRILFFAIDLRIMLMASNSIQNSQHYLRIGFEDMKLCFTAGKVSISMDTLIVSRNPDREVETAQIFLRNASLTLSLHWELIKDGPEENVYSHYLIPDISKFPVNGGVPDTNFDSYSSFRSSGLKISVYTSFGENNVKIKSGNLNESFSQSENCSYITFDGISFSWFQKWYHFFLNPPVIFSQRRPFGAKKRKYTTSFSKNIKEIYFSSNMKGINVEIWENIDSNSKEGLTLTFEDIQIVSLHKREETEIQLPSRSSDPSEKFYKKVYPYSMYNQRLTGEKIIGYLYSPDLDLDNKERNSGTKDGFDGVEFFSCPLLGSKQLSVIYEGNSPPWSRSENVHFYSNNNVNNPSLSTKYVNDPFKSSIQAQWTPEGELFPTIMEVRVSESLNFNPLSDSSLKGKLSNLKRPSFDRFGSLEVVSSNLPSRKFETPDISYISDLTQKNEIPSFNRSSTVPNQIPITPLYEFPTDNMSDEENQSQLDSGTDTESFNDENNSEDSTEFDFVYHLFGMRLMYSKETRDLIGNLYSYYREWKHPIDYILTYNPRKSDLGEIKNKRQQSFGGSELLGLVTSDEFQKRNSIDIKNFEINDKEAANELLEDLVALSSKLISRKLFATLHNPEVNLRSDLAFAHRAGVILTAKLLNVSGIEYEANTSTHTSVEKFVTDLKFSDFQVFSLISKTKNVGITLETKSSAFETFWIPRDQEGQVRTTVSGTTERSFVCNVEPTPMRVEYISFSGGELLTSSEHKKSSHSAFWSSSASDKGIDNVNIFLEVVDWSVNQREHKIIMDIFNNLLLSKRTRMTVAQQEIKSLLFGKTLALDKKESYLEKHQNEIKDINIKIKNLLYMIEEENLEEVQDDFDDNMSDIENEFELEIQAKKNEYFSELSILLDKRRTMMITLKLLVDMAIRNSYEDQDLLLWKFSYYIKQVHWRMVTMERNPICLVTLKKLSGSMETSASGDSINFEIDYLIAKNQMQSLKYANLCRPWLKSGQKWNRRDKIMTVTSRIALPVGGLKVYDSMQIQVFPMVLQLTSEIVDALIDYFNSPISGFDDSNSETISNPQTEILKRNPNIRNSTPKHRSMSIDFSKSPKSSERKSSPFRRNSVLVEPKRLQKSEKDNSNIEKPITRSKSRGRIMGRLGRSTDKLQNLPPPMISFSDISENEEPVLLSSSPTSESGKKNKLSKVFRKRSSTTESIDDINRMHERANISIIFHYFALNQLDLLVSYHGKKDRNITSFDGWNIQVHTVTYFGITSSWSELLKRIQNDITKDVYKQTRKLVAKKLGMSSGHREDESLLNTIRKHVRNASTTNLGSDFEDNLIETRPRSATISGTSIKESVVGLDSSINTVGDLVSSSSNLKYAPTDDDLEASKAELLLGKPSRVSAVTPRGTRKRFFSKRVISSKLKKSSVPSIKENID